MHHHINASQSNIEQENTQKHENNVKDCDSRGTSIYTFNQVSDSIVHTVLVKPLNLIVLLPHCDGPQEIFTKDL